MTDNVMSGIVAYPVTPYSADGQVNTAGLRGLLDRMIDAGVDAIAPLGSTGESAYLDRAEWEAVAPPVSSTPPGGCRPWSVSRI